MGMYFCGSEYMIVLFEITFPYLIETTLFIATTVVLGYFCVSKINFIKISACSSSRNSDGSRISIFKGLRSRNLVGSGVQGWGLIIRGCLEAVFA